MNKTILGKLLLITVLLALFSCSSDPSDDEPGVDMEHDFLLIGEWTASKASDNHALADKLQFYADGTGTYSDSDGDGTLKWGTSGSKLQITFDNKVVNESTFTLTGAMLTTSDGQSYVLNLPILGRWYADDFDNTYNEAVVSYYFSESGGGAYVYLDSEGLMVNETFSWKRMESGSIKLHLKSGDKEIGYVASDDALIIPTLGNFTRKNKLDLTGDWYSVYSEAGSVEKGEERYNTIDLRNNSVWNHSGACTYMKNGRKWVQNFIWSQINDSYIHITWPDDDIDVLLNYRYRYNRATKYMCLEISRDDDFRQYIGYMKVVG